MIATPVAMPARGSKENTEGLRGKPGIKRALLALYTAE